MAAIGSASRRDHLLSSKLISYFYFIWVLQLAMNLTWVLIGAKLNFGNLDSGTSGVFPDQDLLTYTSSPLPGPIVDKGRNDAGSNQLP